MSRRGFWLRHVVWPAALLTLAVVLVNVARVDFRVADFFYDPARGAFLARGVPWVDAVLHRGGRHFAAVVGGSAILLWFASWGWARGRRLRPGAAYVALCFALGPGLVALGKHTTNMDCPWDLAEYGGDRPYVALLEPQPAGLPSGQCFPSGHSSGAFAFFAFYFLLRRYRPRHAPAALAGTLLLGLAFAATQWARGAHFPSHDLASAAIGWYTSLALAALCLRRRTPARAALPVLRESYVQ